MIEKNGRPVATPGSKRKVAKKAPVSVGKLKKKITELDVEREHLRDLLLRRTAEFDNFKKRTESEYASIIENANAALVSDLLPALDDLERSLSSAKEEGDFDGLFAGVELICKNFNKVLAKNGVEPIEAVGHNFDPERHSALLQVESEDHSPGVVVDEHLRGYSMNGRVIRHSQVLVSK